MILEGEFYSHALKEQALCILANIADGSSSKTFIMENEDLLRKINSFMVQKKSTQKSQNLTLITKNCLKKIDPYSN